MDFALSPTFNFLAPVSQSGSFFSSQFILPLFNPLTCEFCHIGIRGYDEQEKTEVQALPKFRSSPGVAWNSGSEKGMGRVPSCSAAEITHPLKTVKKLTVQAFF
ncbi:MAG TPA: hypothetical protein DEG47_29525, partial [Cyanobacteria bacterium UBA11148]|nr:hypothetical protein [Cyanobacteria bacterium UBA11148]